MVAPAVALSATFGSPLTGAFQDLGRPALAPPHAARLPQRSSRGFAMTQPNPVVAENCPDPGVLDVDGRFYMVSTSHVLPAFPIRVSADLVHWEHTGSYVFTRENRPRWARDHFWAPELHRAGEGYVAYFTARSRQTGRLCIGAATAPSPIGPYEAADRPLVSEGVAVLDPTFFRDDDGRQYLYWKMDGPHGPNGPICVQELSPDGLQFIGPRAEVATNDLAWEAPLIEAPSVLKRGGYYYLFYSGGDYDTPHYAVGVARSTSPRGGFEKRGGPILYGSDRWKGPGHNSIATLQGQDYIVYHAWEGDRFRDVRPAMVDRIEWRDDGWPYVNDGHPSSAGGAVQG